MFFPGLRRGACQEDVEASGPPAAPRGAADRRGQLRGRRGAGGCRAQRSAPHPCRALLAAPLTPWPTPSRGQGPRLGLPGLGLPGPAPRASCGGWSRSLVTAAWPGPREGFPGEADRPGLPPSLPWILLEPPQPGAPRERVLKAVHWNLLSAPPSQSLSGILEIRRTRQARKGSCLSVTSSELHFPEMTPSDSQMFVGWAF